MRSHIQSQSFGSMGVETYFGISADSIFRKLAVSKSLPAKPMMANCLGRTSSWARLQRAGMSFRLVRSPVAPKITITHGDGVGFTSGWFRLIGKFPVFGRQMAAEILNGPISSRRVRRIGSASRRELWPQNHLRRAT